MMPYRSISTALANTIIALGVAEIVVEIAEPAVGNTAGDGVRHGACGILGGANGVPHRYTLNSKERPPRAIKTKETGLVIRPGDVLVLESGGGGGWGKAADRDPAAVTRDADNGFISPPPQAGERVRDAGGRPEGR